MNTVEEEGGQRTIHADSDGVLVGELVHGELHVAVLARETRKVRCEEVPAGAGGEGEGHPRYERDSPLNRRDGATQRSGDTKTLAPYVRGHNGHSDEHKKQARSRQARAQRRGRRRVDGS